MNTRRVGNVGLGRAIAYFTKQNYTVCVPLTDSQPYDLITELDGNVSRVSVKYTTRKNADGSKWIVGLRTSSQNSRGTKDKPFDKASCDVVFVACSDGVDFLIPVEDVKVSALLTLTDKFMRV